MFKKDKKKKKISSVNFNMQIDWPFVPFHDASVSFDYFLSDLILYFYVFEGDKHKSEAKSHILWFVWDSLILLKLKTFCWLQIKVKIN